MLLLSGMPFFKRLELDVAYRDSDYDIGRVGTYKGSLEWVPTDGLLLRGGYQRAIRVPFIGEFFAPATQSASTLGNNFATGGDDPCDVRGVYRNGPNAAQVAAFVCGSGHSGC